MALVVRSEVELDAPNLKRLLRCCRQPRPLDADCNEKVESGPSLDGGWN